MESGRYFEERLFAANEILSLINERFYLEEDQDPKQVYYWLVDIERQARRIGLKYFSRRGRKTLIGFLFSERLWLRTKVYEKSELSLNELLDDDGKIKPFITNGRTIDFEQIISDIEKETEILREIFNQYSEVETGLIEESKQKAKENIKTLYK